MKDRYASASSESDEMSSGFIMDSPDGLSPRARAFLANNATRVKVNLELTGEALRSEMVRVIGGVDEVLLRTLSVAQARYAGLSYQSGFFDATVKFAPSFEPDAEDDELEILYAVDTGSVAGASLTKFGEVDIGVDALGFIEFRSLDTLIESDAMFATAAARPMARTVHLEGRLDEPAAVAAMVQQMEMIPLASGNRTWWFTSPTADVFYCGIWHDLGLGLPPFVKVWTSDPVVNENFGRFSHPATTESRSDPAARS